MLGELKLAAADASREIKTKSSKSKTSEMVVGAKSARELTSSARKTSEVFSIRK